MMDGVEGPDPTARTLPIVRLSATGQTYVAIVGLLALLSNQSGGWPWYVALVLLASPLSPLALWVGFYATVSMGAALMNGPADLSYLVTGVWVLVWMLTAWLNARVWEKVLQRGWAGRWLETTDD
jgi:hypothetical protein